MMNPISDFGRYLYAPIPKMEGMRFKHQCHICDHLRDAEYLVDRKIGDRVVEVCNPNDPELVCKKIHNVWDNTPGLYISTFDNYDGAPDALPEHQLVGFGKTEAEAIENLKEQWDS